MTKQAAGALLEALDRKIEEFHLLKHPFYKAWTEGTLSRAALSLYAAQYYKHVQAFPEHLGTLAARVEGELKEIVEDNLREEVDPTAPHPKLWRSFAGALGVSEETLRATTSLPGIAGLVNEYGELAAKGSPAEAVAGFYAYETQVPEIAAQKIAGLQKFYGITEAPALAYFAVHQEADVRHRAAWREWLAAQPEAEGEAMLAAAERGLKALWGALDAVYPEGCAAN
jgi:pyrroloquinoline-quinone synthase